MPSMSISLSLRGQILSGAFSPSEIFTFGEVGVWYDPSDITTLFQDSAGTTPVTASGQPVGLILDKSGNGKHASQPVAGSRPTYQVSNGFSWLAFDGVDDFLVTATITPTSDKVTIVSGVRKTSDAALGALVELGTYGAPGTFSVGAPGGASATYRFGSCGTIAVAALSGTTYAAPITNVLTGIGSVSEDISTLRINGSQAATAATDQGTGNYAAAPLYIGRRTGTLFPFSGNLYGLIIRTSANALTASDITSAENWMNSKTGAF